METLENDNEKLNILSSEYAKFYELHSDVDLKEITSELLQSPFVKENEKQSIRKFHRRVFVFTYLSDGLKIKGLISFVPDPENHPLLVLLRGGNRVFGILNPGGDLICLEKYTVIATTYRGGISEGVDQFGGEDVNDVKNLIDFIPELEKKFQLHFRKQKAFILGISRGAMQMFLALTRFPELQDQFFKAVSLSGLLDIRQFIAFRPDIEAMFMRDFGLEKGVNEEKWFNQRDPLLTVPKLSSKLPILIVQANHDFRVNVKEGYHIVSKLKEAGKNVTYWEIESENHGLKNVEGFVDSLIKWLEN